MQLRSLLLCAAFVSIGACSRIPLAAYSNHGQPESLLDVSSEVVAVQLSSSESLGEISHWMETDPPSRAEIHCAAGDPLCAQAEDVLKVYGLNYQTSAAEQSVVNLVYERIAARDCENRYIDNSINPYNLPSPTSGCSVAANMLQQVTDKRQFVNPALLDFADAQHLVSVYNMYINPELGQAKSASSREAKGDTLASQIGSSGS